MNPEISIIVCTYNREKYLKTCLDHLKNQTLSADQYEVIIINNNSTDRTENICLNFIQEYQVDNFRYFVEKQMGLSFARNRGIKESKAGVLSFIDDDAFAYPDFSKNVVTFFNQYAGVNAIGGKINPVFEGEKPGWLSKHLMPLVSAQDLGTEIKQFSPNKFPIGANMSFRAEVFMNFGMFNVDLGRRGNELEGGEEKELFLKLKKTRQKIYYVPNVVVDHIIPQKRVEIDYIKRLAIGVGTSERKRIAEKGFLGVAKKIFEEVIKGLATLLLFVVFFFSLAYSKGLMLVKFRFWVLRGLIFNR